MVDTGDPILMSTAVLLESCVWQHGRGLGWGEGRECRPPRRQLSAEMLSMWRPISVIETFPTSSLGLCNFVPMGKTRRGSIPCTDSDVGAFKGLFGVMGEVALEGEEEALLS